MDPDDQNQEDNTQPDPVVIDEWRYESAILAEADKIRAGDRYQRMVWMRRAVFAAAVLCALWVGYSAGKKFSGAPAKASSTLVTAKKKNALTSTTMLRLLVDMVLMDGVPISRAVTPGASQDTPTTAAAAKKPGGGLSGVNWGQLWKDLDRVTAQPAVAPSQPVPSDEVPQPPAPPTPRPQPAAISDPWNLLAPATAVQEPVITPAPQRPPVTTPAPRPVARPQRPAPAPTPAYSIFTQFN